MVKYSVVISDKRTFVNIKHCMGWRDDFKGVQRSTKTFNFILTSTPLEAHCTQS